MVELFLTAPSQHEYESALKDAINNRIASRIAAHDPTEWGPEAVSEASIRLSWTGLAESSRPLIAEILELREALAAKGLDHVVLCGMGGSSLAPEVICTTYGVPLTVLDSSQPDMVRAAIANDLERSIVVVSSKSGGTIETDSQRRAYEKAFTDAGLVPTDHIIVVTDPGSPLDREATQAGYRVFHADPHVGGRYSALTAFGLVPSGLAGADVGELLDQAASAQDDVAVDGADNPALRLGVLLGVAHRHQVDKLVMADQSRHGFGDWIEQLVAESTGKNGKGILPVVVPFENAVNFNPSTADSVLLSIDGDSAPEAQSGYGIAIRADLGAEMLIWETAVAVAGSVIGINPFDQPDVESAKQAARDLLGGGGEKPTPDVTVGAIDVYGHDGSSITETITWLLDQLDLDHGYVALQVYLDRFDHADFAGAREIVAQRTGRPTTFGWGPRFLHSTGQYHKGGPATGVYLQVTGDPIEDLSIPGREFTFGSFIESQAAGDAAVLRQRGRPVVRLHLKDVPAGLQLLRTALAGRSE
ncbi:glucose-6-phosphate isomerase [Aeromicrobium panaciterrae]|uniref:glucose-6-phosphate isomerase n=1 Tax=Aeromicrobium panaciterrae TaxID=363861 RepID=UPI0031DEC5E5